MKKPILFFILLFAFSSLAFALSFSVGVDALSLLSFAYDSIGVGGEASLFVGDCLRINLAFNYYDTNDPADQVRFFNPSLSADYFPFEDLGLYVGVSLADIYFSSGLDSDGKVRYSNYLHLGYAWNLPFFTLDGRLNMRDLASSSGNDATYLAGKIGQLDRFSFSLILSFRYDWKDDNNQEVL